MDKEKLVCLIPIFNEAGRIENTLKNISNIEEIDEVIVVNDGSTDDSLEQLKALDVDYFTYDKNMGKGYAIKYALDRIEYDYLILLDGDLEETSNQVINLIEPVKKGLCDASIAKFPEAKTVTNKKGGFGIVKNLAKKGVKFFTGHSMDTSLSGQRVYRKEVIEAIDYIPNRYGIEVAMTIQTLNEGFKFLDVPVEMSHRYTERNLRGFIHRGRQFKDILFTFIKMYFKGYKR